MKKVIFLIAAICLLTSCSHKVLKTPKKAPCDFSKIEIKKGFEDNTK